MFEIGPNTNVQELTREELKELLLAKARVAVDMDESVFRTMCQMVFGTVWGMRYDLQSHGDKFQLTINEPK